MEKSRSRTKRNRVDERASQASNKYIKDSLEGRWVTVAKQWIKDNQPCTYQQYIDSVPQLMPTHINQFRGFHDPQLSAAKSAIAKLKYYRQVIAENGFLLIEPSKNASKYGWEEKTSGMVSVDLRIAEDGKPRHALRSWLLRRGYKSVGDQVMSKCADKV